MARTNVMIRERQDEGAGGRLVSTDGRALPLAAVRLRAEARGGVARAVLVQVFRNVHADPLQVTYRFPLPHGGAVSGFAFRLGGRRVVGEVDRLADARDRFEQAILEGRSAALLEQERGSLFTQELGNVPPGAEVEAELTVDQKLDWRGEGAWEWRFPTAVAPRYQGGPGRVPDAARTAVEIADGPLAPRLTLALAIRDDLPPGRRPESPSHALAWSGEGALLRASFQDGAGVPLDRDVVVRWPAALPRVGVALDAFRPAGGRLDGRAFGLLTLTPPAPGEAPRTVPRDLVVLLDTSGSMAGEPLEKARRVVAALVDSLGPDDSLELVAFSHAPRRWRPGAAPASDASRADALRWLARLEAAGGTEMREGLREALRGLRPEAQRQVVLVTDGLIGFEEEVVAEILGSLPAGSRVHTVGVGSAVNRSLTGPAARAGRGTEVVIGLGEDAERAAAALRARTAAPIVTGLHVAGSALVQAAPERLPDLFAGAPALVPLELRPEGGALTVRGVTADGPFEQRVDVRPAAPGSGSAALAPLFGREAVEDLELRLAAGEGRDALDRSVEALGLAFQIATRLTSWVALSEERTVDPSRPIRRERMPGALPHGMSVEALGLRSSPVLAMSLGPPMLHQDALVPRSLSESVGRRGVSARGGAPGPAPRPPPRRPEPLMSADSLPVPARRLAAVLRPGGRGREIVLEVSVSDGPLAWAPPRSVTVWLADGTARDARVDGGKSTAPGTVAPPQVLRLVLRVPRPSGAAIASVELVVGDERLVLDVRDERAP